MLPMIVSDENIITIAMLFFIFIFLFALGFINRFIMIMAGIVSLFLGFQLWQVTGTILFMPIFLFVFAVCIVITITSK